MNTSSTINAPAQPHRPAWLFNPAEGRLRSGWRLAIQALLFLGGSFLARVVLGMLVGFALTLAGVDVQDPRALAALPIDPLVRVLISAATLGILLLVSGFAARRLDRRPFSAYGLRRGRRAFADLGFGLLLGALLMLVVFLFERRAGWIDVTPNAITPAIAFAIFCNLLAYIGVGITEELFSRGYQLRNLAEGLNLRGRHPRLAVLLAYAITSAIFGLLHVINPNATLSSTLMLMLAGLLMGLGAVLTGELGISIGLHISWNFFLGIVFGFPVSGSSHTAALLHLQQSGPLLWTGGDFGPEAGLVVLAAILLGAALILAWVRLTRGHLSPKDTLAIYRQHD